MFDVKGKYPGVVGVWDVGGVLYFRISSGANNLSPRELRIAVIFPSDSSLLRVELGIPRILEAWEMVNGWDFLSA